MGTELKNILKHSAYICNSVLDKRKDALPKMNSGSGRQIILLTKDFNVPSLPPFEQAM